jgi:hypothetical protein
MDHAQAKIPACSRQTVHSAEESLPTRSIGQDRFPGDENSAGRAGVDGAGESCMSSVQYQVTVQSYMSNVQFMESNVIECAQLHASAVTWANIATATKEWSLTDLVLKRVQPRRRTGLDNLQLRSLQRRTQVRHHSVTKVWN